MRGLAARSGVLVLCALCACHCDDKTPVPFKRGDADTDKTRVDAGASLPPAHAVQNAVTTTYSDATLRVVVEGAVAERTRGSFRAALAADLDGDGTREALFVTTDAQGRPAIETALRKSAKLVAGAAVRLVNDDATCSVGAARLDALGESLAVARLSFTCAPKNPVPPAVQPSAAPIAALAPAAPSEHRYVITLEATPRVALHLALRAPEPGTAPLGLSLAVEDRDADEHPDVRLDIDAPMPAGPPKRVSLLWFDRPSGLARDAAEPEHALEALATEASGYLPKNPEQALATAEAVLALHTRVCRESGRAELQVDDEPGVACGASIAAGRAAVVRVVGLTRRRALLPSLEAFTALSLPAYRVDDAQRKRAARALASIPGDTDFIWQKGPALRAPDSPGLRLPALGFIDEDHLLLRGPIAQSYELAGQTQTPVALAGSVLLSDGHGGPTVVDIVRTCDGRHLRLSAASQGLDDASSRALAGGIAKETVGALIEHGASQDPACTANTIKPDRTGFAALGFTAQGLLLAKGAALWLVASPDSAISSEPRELAVTEAAPPLLAAGASSSDGLHHVLATSEGVALVTRGAAPTVRLIRTPPSCTEAPSDAVLSPSGARVAMLCGGQVYVAARGSLPSPAASAATPAAAAPTPAAPSLPTSIPPVPVTALPPPAPEAPPPPSP